MPRFPLAGGLGDMTKAVYDPDGNNKIALAQIESQIAGSEITLDISDKDLHVGTTEYCTNTASWVIKETYTVSKSDMTIKWKKIKAAISCWILGNGALSHGGYTKNSVVAGDVVQIGQTNGVPYTEHTLTDIEFVVGDVIRFWAKAASTAPNNCVKDFKVKQTHILGKNAIFEE